MSREAVQNLNQHIRVGTARDGAESCSSKTLRWTAGMRKKRSFRGGVAKGFKSDPKGFIAAKQSRLHSQPRGLVPPRCSAVLSGEPSVAADLQAESDRITAGTIRSK